MRSRPPTPPSEPEEPVSLYDAVRDLPLVVDDYALEGLEQQVSSGFLRKSTVIRLAGAGEEGLGEDVTYEATEHDLVLSAGAHSSSCRRVDDRDVLRPPGHARALRPRARAARLPRLPPLGLRERRARSRAAPGGLSLGDAVGQVGPAADVRRFDATRRAGDDRRGSAPGSSSTRTCGSSSTRHPTGPRS